MKRMQHIRVVATHPNVLHPFHNTYLSSTTQLGVCSTPWDFQNSLPLNKKVNQQNIITITQQHTVYTATQPNTTDSL